MQKYEERTTLVFVASGCGACEDYLPRFRRYVRGKYKILDVASDSRAASLADRFRVDSTPTTFIYTPQGVKRYAGSLPDAILKKIYWS